MKTHFALLRAAGRFAILATLGFLSATQTFAQTLVNSSFEEPRLTPGVAYFNLVDESSVLALALLLALVGVFFQPRSR